LASRAVSQWCPILVDIDPERIAAAAVLPGVEAHCGDATSSLVLKRANVEGASYGVAITGDDEVNMEFCRLLREQYNVPNLTAVVHDPGVAERLRKLGVVTVNRPDSVAAILQSSFDRGRRTTSDVGLGIGEICQVTVQSHSPVIGKSLSTLRPQAWLLAAIYRDGKLVVPHGSTTIETGDKCLLVGDPRILQGIADYFQRGSSEFPLQFGTRYCLLESEDLRLPNLDECQWLVENTGVKGIAALYRGTAVNPDILERFGETVESRSLPASSPDELTRLADEVDCAVLVTPAVVRGWKDKWGIGNAPFFATLDRTPDPVLISRGTYPYKKILVAVSPAPGSMRATELAVDVSRQLGAALTAVAVQPPDFVVGSEYQGKLVSALEATKAKAHLYSRRIETHLLEGNPVTQVLKLSGEFDLLVVAHRRSRQYSMTRTDVSRHLITGAACSVVVLPYGKQDL
jgi:Trk K+ transport system NAD-binding subunit/nucleotide-binding universal stress UspA family protein